MYAHLLYITKSLCGLVKPGSTPLLEKDVVKVFVWLFECHSKLTRGTVAAPVMNEDVQQIKNVLLILKKGTKSVQQYQARTNAEVLWCKVDRLLHLRKRG